MRRQRRHCWCFKGRGPAAMEEEGSGEEGRLEAAAAATAREGKRAGRRKDPVQQRRAWLRQRHLRQREEKAEEGLAAATKCLAAIEAAGKRRQRPELAGIAGGWLRQRETEEEGWAAAAEGTTVLAWPVDGKRSDYGKDGVRLLFLFFWIAATRWQGRMKDANDKDSDDDDDGDDGDEAERLRNHSRNVEDRGSDTN
ncbi:hypothetical protein GW17_00060799 [Ensete ventricosum]|nr:hypothetical protein GW17_00060799 [Ensete ventricosum]